MSEFVWGMREAGGVERGRERSGCRGTLTRVAHAGRKPLVAHATATAHPGRTALAATFPTGGGFRYLKLSLANRQLTSLQNAST